MTIFIPGDSLITKTWAGGTTTQIFIYPENTEYPKFNFTFRISSATVEVDESEFTFMPGVTRHLIILDGKLWLNHRARYSVDLNPFQKDVFNGEWSTHAKGRVRDFNLMTRNGASGACEAIHLKANDQQRLELNKDYAFIFVVSGLCSINLNNENHELRNGDTLILHNKSREVSALISSLENTNAIWGSVKL